MKDTSSLAVTIAAVLLILGLLAATDHAFAESSNCGSASAIIEMLDKFGEIPVFSGISDDTDTPAALSGFVNYQTGTFTIIERINRGTFCIVLSGTNWEDI
jgi:hypothetical protein